VEAELIRQTLNAALHVANGPLNKPRAAPAGNLDAALGPSPATTEFLDAAADLAAALDRAFAARAALRRAATDSGISGSVWARLLQGNYAEQNEITSTPLND
jgi:hypothetical protein